MSQDRTKSDSSLRLLRDPRIEYVRIQKYTGYRDMHRTEGTRMQTSDTGVGQWRTRDSKHQTLHGVFCCATHSYD